jgi:hypothetical protein
LALLVEELEEPVELDAEPVDEVEELEEPEVEALAAALIGSKVLFATPKPMTEASVPLPPIAMVSVSFLLVTTS